MTIPNLEKSMSSNRLVASPCTKKDCTLYKNLCDGVRRDSTELKTGICKNCCRTGEEISNWGKYDQDKRARIMSRLSERGEILSFLKNQHVDESSDLTEEIEKKIISLQKLTYDHVDPKIKVVRRNIYFKNCLVLDDDENRLSQFESKLNSCNVILTSQVSECIDSLQNEKIDILFLDHDLNGKAFVDSNAEEQNGYDVAKWVSENPLKFPKTIVLHSLNPDGRRNMEEILRRSAESNGIDVEIIDMPGAWVNSFPFPFQL